MTANELMAQEVGTRIRFEYKGEQRVGTLEKAWMSPVYNNLCFKIKKEEGGGEHPYGTYQLPFCKNLEVIR